MQKKRIVILGGGISGLSLAYYLSSQQALFEIQLIEKEDHLGGWIDSIDKGGFFFERGPRIFRSAKSTALLSLIQEIGMENEMVLSSPQGQGKYLWSQGKLHKAPILSWGVVRGLLSEWSVPPYTGGDESVWDFACRRFNRRVAKQVFDPLVVGIFGGDSREISVQACFPLLKKWETEYGSLTKGFFKAPKSQQPFMFSFRAGMKSMIERLKAVTPVRFHLQEEVVALDSQPEGVVVKTTKDSYTADYVFSALSSQVLGQLLLPELLSIPLKGATLIHVGYATAVLRHKGFGYLVASSENEEVLGVVFDSHAFPTLNHSTDETRLTVMLKREDLSEAEALKEAFQALKRHLGIVQKPQFFMVARAPKAFPQLLVGHQKRIQHIEERARQKHPRLRLVGNYFDGIGVNDCIVRAKSVAENFLRAVAS